MGAQILFGGKLGITGEAAELLKNSAEMLRIYKMDDEILIKHAKSTNIYPGDRSVKIGNSILFVQKEVLETPIELCVEEGKLVIKKTYSF
ncbi:MAG: hypothetical protein J7K68_03465 [Candidatus Diapherotrites archaeon]|nr:hypothetical protein [Candidatus Diapherotrites archaeon]